MPESLDRRPEAFDMALLPAGEDRRQRPAVERALHADDPGLVRVAARMMIFADHLDAELDRLGARIAEEHRVGEGVAHELLAHLLLAGDGEDVRAMPQLVRLIGQRLDQRRMAVAEAGHGDAAGEVQESSAVGAVKVGAFTALESDIRPPVCRHEGRDHDPVSFVWAGRRFPRAPGGLRRPQKANDDASPVAEKRRSLTLAGDSTPPDIERIGAKGESAGWRGQGRGETDFRCAAGRGACADYRSTVSGL